MGGFRCNLPRSRLTTALEAWFRKSDLRRLERDFIQHSIGYPLKRSNTLVSKVISPTIVACVCDWLSRVVTRKCRPSRDGNTWKCDQDVLLLSNSLVLERGELREHVPGNSNVTITMHTLLHQIKKSSVAILNCDNHVKLRAN